MLLAARDPWAVLVALAPLAVLVLAPAPGVLAGLAWLAWLIPGP